jgi:low affinity Fe/Cu permease
MASEPVRNGSWAYRLGCVVSDKVSDTFAHPYAQVAFLVVCIAWFAGGWNVNILTAALSIMAITLTQMVLNSQNERETDDHRRDVAMHAKLDELIAATHSAKNEFVGIEERAEDEIVELKEEVKDAVESVRADATGRESAGAPIAKGTAEERPPRNGRKTSQERARAAK